MYKFLGYVLVCFLAALWSDVAGSPDGGGNENDYNLNHKSGEAELPINVKSVGYNDENDGEKKFQQHQKTLAKVIP